jgi:hypothetical protein
VVDCERQPAYSSVAALHSDSRYNRSSDLR